MKKLLICLTIIFVATAPFFISSNSVVYADNIKEPSLEDQLKEETDKQLENLDLSGLEGLLKDLNNKDVFGKTSFIEKVKSIINGEFSKDSASVFKAIINLIFDELLNFLPLIATIIAVAILSGLLSELKGGTSSKSVGNIIHFLCYGLIIILLTNAIRNMLSLTSNTLQGMKSQIDVAFPVLLTVLTAIGGTASVGIYQPAVALFAGSIMQIFNAILMPLFIFTLVFSIISNLSTSVKLEKFSSFFSSAFKWVTGVVFTVFMGFLVIQGITAGSVDTVTIRTAKYAIRSYVPILGGYLSEGFNVIMASSILIKNAIGASGLLLMLSSVIVPLVTLILFMFCLKLTAAILEPLTDSRISNFIGVVSKSMIMPIVLIIGVSFMYLIFVGLIMCTGNFI